MQFGVVSLFPELVQSATQYGVLARGIERGFLKLQCWNPRTYTHDRHRTVDDRPYGGGPGMLMKVQPLKDAIDAARLASGNKGHVVYLSPQGEKLTHQKVKALARRESLILVCGRYEGVDERLVNTEIDEEISIGDYVLSGGEYAALVLMDAVGRLIPGVLGHEGSAEEDSFAQGLLDCPHYTRPENYQGLRVPEVLMSGDHAAIEQWRLKQALGRTWLRRPDLLTDIALNDEQNKLLDEFINEVNR